MSQDCFIGITFFNSVSHCKWYCHPDNKHEKRLYQVPEMQPVPFMMAELGTKKLHDTAVFKRLKMAIDPCAFTY
jgi:hypothetical protein